MTKTNTWGGRAAGAPLERSARCTGTGADRNRARRCWYAPAGSRRTAGRRRDRRPPALVAGLDRAPAAGANPATCETTGRPPPRRRPRAGAASSVTGPNGQPAGHEEIHHQRGRARPEGATLGQIDARRRPLRGGGEHQEPRHRPRRAWPPRSSSPSLLAARTAKAVANHQRGPRGAGPARFVRQRPARQHAAQREHDAVAFARVAHAHAPGGQHQADRRRRSPPPRPATLRAAAPRPAQSRPRRRCRPRPHSHHHRADGFPLRRFRREVGHRAHQHEHGEERTEEQSVRGSRSAPRRARRTSAWRPRRWRRRSAPPLRAAKTPPPRASRASRSMVRGGVGPRRLREVDRGQPHDWHERRGRRPAPMPRARGP